MRAKRQAGVSFSLGNFSFTPSILPFVLRASVLFMRAPARKWTS